jgi:hypothetical protein
MIKIAFINPPHADWITPNLATWFYMKSHYDRVGKYKNQVQWLTPPYRYNQYQSTEEIYEEIKEADIIIFSSYFWNYDICDEIAALVKTKDKDKINLIGGPHIGIIDGSFDKRKHLYDYYCQPTKPGEVFIEDFINLFIESKSKPDPELVSWEIRCVSGRKHDFSGIAIYEENFNILKEICDYANQYDLEKFSVIETTRGCPYQCTFCEWGGGIGTKVIKQELEIVKRDLLALKKAGYKNVFLTDANFGMFEDRDLEIFKFAWENDIKLTDLSTVKVKNLERRIRLIDACFEIMGKNKSESGYPTLSIQTSSDEAIKIAKRTDLSFDDKIKLSEHIFKRFKEGYITTPTLELIMGMPGSTIDDFYKEFDMLYNFQSWNSYRHDYMFLPDAEISRPEYLKKYGIELVEVYSDLIDEDSVDNFNSFYGKRKSYFKTISQCFSFTNDEICEMFFMNQAGNWILKEVYYSGFESLFSPSEFTKKSYQILKKLDGFSEIYSDIKEIYNVDSEPKNIKRILNGKRNEVIVNFLKNNKIFLTNEMFR